MIQKDLNRKAASPMSEFSRPEPSSCWVLTDGKAGDEAQCIGVAEALGLPYSIHKVSPKPPFSWLMPWGPIDPREAETVPGSPIAPPYPDIAIASGRRSIAYLKRLKKISSGQTFTVCLKDPRTGIGAADFIWVAEHDRLRGDNVFVTTTAPHRFSAASLASAWERIPEEIRSLPHPKVAVLIGGDSRHHKFLTEDVEVFCRGLLTMQEETGASFMATCSRRTPRALKSRMEEIISSGRGIFWNERGENPLKAYLASADAIVATADSTNMIGEAAATGKPIHVFSPHGGHPKIDQFLGRLRQMGILHPFPGPLKKTTYEPLDSTPLIAAKIREAYAQHKFGRSVC